MNTQHIHFFEKTYSETIFYVTYKENKRIITINCGKNREAAEARLAELKGGKNEQRNVKI